MNVQINRNSSHLSHLPKMLEDIPWIFTRRPIDIPTTAEGCLVKLLIVKLAPAQPIAPAPDKRGLGEASKG